MLTAEVALKYQMRVMSGLPSSYRTALLGIAAAVVGIIVVVFVVARREGQPSGESERRLQPNQPVVTKGPSDAGVREPRWQYQAEDLHQRPELLKGATWRPPRPLRLVVKYGEKGASKRTADEARKRAENARSRFLEGESAYELIRELSDPPRGIPAKLIEQYQSLPADEASPVVPLDDGFAVFFGTPSERPTPPETPAGEEEPADDTN